MKTIQMIVTDSGEAMFIIGFNEESNEITFRSSFNPGYLQTEKILLRDNMVYTNVHHFPIDYLKKFLSESQLD